MGRGDSDGLAGTEAIGAIDDDLGSGGRAAIENRVLPFCERDLNGLHLGGLSAFSVVVDDPDEKGAVQPGLNGSGRYDERVRPVFKHEVDVYELVGKQN
jgi:hypothetical protein